MGFTRLTTRARCNMKGYITGAVVGGLMMFVYQSFPRLNAIMITIDGGIFVFIVLMFWCGVITVRYEKD
jgi:hypothetical protein